MMEQIKEIERLLERFDKILLMTQEQSLQCKESEAYSSLSNSEKSKILILTPDCDGYELWKDLYSTYEFSDKVLLFEESECYPTIWNFMQSGLLTQEEIWKSILR